MIGQTFEEKLEGFIVWLFWSEYQFKVFDLELLTFFKKEITKHAEYFVWNFI